MECSQDLNGAALSILGGSFKEEQSMNRQVGNADPGGPGLQASACL